jgi:hypothetical protein
VTAGLFWAVFVLIAMGWFSLGWIARGHENRRYAESRLRALAADAVLDAYMPVESQRQHPSPAPGMSGAPAIHVHLPASSPAWAPVIDAQPVQAIEGRQS